MDNSYLDLLAYFGIGGAHPGGIRLTKDLLSREKIESHHTVLDVGCGTGQTAELLTQTYNCKVTAVERHPINVEKARERFRCQTELIDLVEGDMQALPFMENSFDFVLAESVVIFTDIDKTLPELSRVVKPRRPLIMIEMTADHPLTNREMQTVHRLYGIREVLSEEEWKERLNQAGFTKVEVIPPPSALTPAEIIDFHPSEHIPEELYDLWDEHTFLLEHSSVPLGYRVFRCYS